MNVLIIEHMFCYSLLRLVTLEIVEVKSSKSILRLQMRKLRKTIIVYKNTSLSSLLYCIFKYNRGHIPRKFEVSHTQKYEVWAYWGSPKYVLF